MGMDMTEELVSGLVKHITGGTTTKYHTQSGEEYEVNWAAPWRRVEMIPALEEATGEKFPPGDQLHTQKTYSRGTRRGTWDRWRTSDNALYHYLRFQFPLASVRYLPRSLWIHGLAHAILSRPRNTVLQLRDNTGSSPSSRVSQPF